MTGLDMGDGIIVTDREKIAKAATKSCEDLFNAKPNDDDNEDDPRRVQQQRRGRQRGRRRRGQSERAKRATGSARRPGRESERIHARRRSCQFQASKDVRNRQHSVGDVGRDVGHGWPLGSGIGVGVQPEVEKHTTARAHTHTCERSRIAQRACIRIREF